MTDLEELMDKFGELPEDIDLQFERTTITRYKKKGRYLTEPYKRRLNAQWTVELEEDLKNTCGIDVEAEVDEILDYEIQREIKAKSELQEALRKLLEDKGGFNVNFETDMGYYR